MDIKSIKDDKFLKDLNNKELMDLASEIRSFLLNSVSKTGGHLSSNLGDVELIIALHKAFDLTKDKLLFDVGHQAYTHKILNGFANDFDKLRQINGLSGFISTSENQYDIFESGHSSTSISTAMGLALARDNNKEDYNIISFIGDASIANGVALEALNQISSRNNKIIIVLNDNDMAINKSVGAIARSLSSIRSSRVYAKTKNGFIKFFKWAPGFVRFVERCVHRFVLIFRSDNMFDNFGVSYLGPINGHNFKALDKAFKKAKSYPGPILIHVRTKKGKGYEFAENDKVGKYHGIGPFDLNTGNEINNDENLSTFTKEVSSVVKDIIRNDKDSYLISPAMVNSCNFNDIFKEIPERCIDVGISEEHAICYANGLALNKKHPYVSIYSTFMQRGYDQIVHDVCRINSNVTFLIDRAGVVAKDGKTHQGGLDVSFTYPLENSIIASISSARYIKPLLTCLSSINGPKFVRYPKLTCIKEEAIEKVEYGKFIEEVYDSTYNKTIIAVGESCEVLKGIILKEHLKINLINPIFLKPLDISCLNKIKDTDIYVYDNTSVYEGFTSAIYEFYNSYNKKITSFTLPHKYIDFGSYHDLLKNIELDEMTVLGKINGK